MVARLLLEEVLSFDVREYRSVSVLRREESRLLEAEDELSVSSLVQGMLIEFVLRFIRCVRSKWCWYWRHKIESFPRRRWSHPIRDC